MKITQIVVSAGRVIPHPHEQFSNLRPSLQLTAVLDDGEDPGAATRKLQAQAEQMIEDHKDHLLEGIEQIAELRLREGEMSKLESLIVTSQERLKTLREGGEVAPRPRRLLSPHRFDEPDEDERY